MTAITLLLDYSPDPVGPLTYWQDDDATATTADIRVKHKFIWASDGTVTDETGAAVTDTPPQIVITASDDPAYTNQPRRLWLEEGFTNTRPNPRPYSLQLLIANGTTQRLGDLRLAAIGATAPDVTTVYVSSVTSADESVTITRTGGAVDLSVTGGGGGGTVTSVAGVGPDGSGDVPLTAGTLGAATVIALNAETTARQSADTALQASVTTNTTNIATNTTNIATNTAAIASEATARASADTTLQTNITAEATARATAVNNEAASRAAGDLRPLLAQLIDSTATVWRVPFALTIAAPTITPAGTTVTVEVAPLATGIYAAASYPQALAVGDRLRLTYASGTVPTSAAPVGLNFARTA